MRGADHLARTLQAHGVTTIFALSGNQIMPVFDAILDTDIRLIHTRHEAATVYMAEAHAQLTGGVGVALVTAGAGLGNAVGSLLAARASDTPLLLLSGDSPTGGDGRGAFQEMDQCALTASLTKTSRRITRADDMAGAVADALDLAALGRPGPVHLALPADVLMQITQTQTTGPNPPNKPAPSSPDLTTFHTATHPLILLGPALTEIRAPGLAARLCHSLNAPTLALQSPRGLNDPSLGQLGALASRADAVLLLGKPVDFTLGFGDPVKWPNAKIWHAVLGDPAQIQMTQDNLGPRLHTATLTDPRAMAEHLATQTSPENPRADWIEQTRSLTQSRSPVPGAGLTSVSLCAAVQRQLIQSPNPILIADGGEFGQWAQAIETDARRVVNGVSGAIGGGIPYAIAAKSADPGATVFALMGDGTAGFHLAEFETAIRENLPFVAVIGNDTRWTAEHLIQTRDFGADRRIGCDLSGARYDQAVQALGGFGVLVSDVNDLDHALKSAVASQQPACVNVAIQGLPAPSL